MGTRTVPDALRAAGATVEVYVDNFRRGIPDETWLAEVGRRGWLVLTKDLQIRYRSVEIAALLGGRVGAFAKNLSGAENAAILVRALRHMERFANGNPRPFIASVSRSGRVKLVARGRRGGPKNAS